MSSLHSPLTIVSQEEKMFYDQAYAFAKARVLPHVREMDEKQEMRPEIVRECFDMGLMGIEVPEKLGGAGSTFFNSIMVIEALARVDASLGVIVDVQNTLVINALLRWGTEAQKARYLPMLAKHTVGSYALSESHSGSDAFALRTSARDAGDHWVLNGTKLWITNAKEAGLHVLMATVDASKGYRGITAFLVERDFAGLKIGKQEDKLGIRASSTCELVLEDCKVPKENVLGEVGLGYKVAIETLNEGRIGIGAQMVGIAQGAFDYAMQYMRERKQFGSRLVDFQGMQFQFADLATEIECARLLVYNAARLKDAGKPFLKEAAMAKLKSSIVAGEVASMGVEFLGGVGFTKDYLSEKFYRDAKIGPIYEGTSNMQRITIAKQLLKEYGD